MIALLTAAALATSSAGAASPPEGDHVASTEQVRIPFARFRIRTFRPVGYDVVYFQDRQRNWYRADLVPACLALPTALRIGLDTFGSSTIGNGSAIIVGGERCHILSLVRSPPPPPRRRRR